MPPLVSRIQGLVDKLTGYLAFLPPLVTRLTLGLTFLSTGWGKLHSLSNLTAYFAGLGIPAPGLQAPFIATLEFVGGICLVLGLCTRVFAGLLACTMIVAMLTALRDKIGSLEDLSGLMEYLYLLLLVWLTVFGAGLASLDWPLAKMWRRRAAS